jgi:hypothetical protein
VPGGWRAPQVARFVDAREPEVRGAALDVMLALFDKVRVVCVYVCVSASKQARYRTGACNCPTREALVMHHGVFTVVVRQLDRNVGKLVKTIDGAVSEKGKALMEDKCRCVHSSLSSESPLLRTTRRRKPTTHLPAMRLQTEHVCKPRSPRTPAAATHTATGARSRRRRPRPRCPSVRGAPAPGRSAAARLRPRRRSGALSVRPCAAHGRPLPTRAMMPTVCVCVCVCGEV